MSQDAQPEIYPWRQWDTTARAFVAHMDHILADTVSISLLDAEVLDELASSAQPRRMCDLGQSVALTRSGMTRAVARLEKLGFVQRTPSPSDKRSMLVSLTEEGRRIQKEAADVTARHGAQIFGAVANGRERRLIDKISNDLRLQIRSRQRAMEEQGDEGASPCSC